MLWKTKKSTYKNISSADAKEMMDNNKDAVILDVRTPSEFAEGHIKNAILIPDYDIRLRSFELGDKDRLLLVYCRSGARAAGACKTLSELGFTNVYCFGGIMSWPYDIIK